MSHAGRLGVAAHATEERIHALWDELAKFDAAGVDGALEHLMKGLCAIVDARNVSWMGALRMSQPSPQDPMLGWRPRVIRFLRHTEVLDAALREQIRLMEAGAVDLTTLRNIALAGRFRANRLIDLVQESWFESDYYKAFYQGAGKTDAIWVGMPVNRDAECYFGVFRGPDKPRFSAAERDLCAHILCGLAWLPRRLLLGHGLLIAKAPVTPTERRVLKCLLTGMPEKQICTEVGLSRHTTHDHVVNLYRKFNVTSRPALMAIWLGRG